MTTTLPKPLLTELLQRCTGNFVPQSLDDFIGAGANKNGSGARCIAAKFENMVAMSRANEGDPIKVLINGLPGLGKTALALYLQRLLGCNKWSTTSLNGTKVRVDMVEELARQMAYKSLFGDYRLIIINEADKIPDIAQVSFLSLLDELPNWAAVVCTSNCKISQFEERFQTRFQAFDILPPTNDELERLVNRFLNDLNLSHQIVLGAGGNVRSALLDTKGIIQN